MRVCVRGGGRPESETDTPVNIGNGPYRDNGEGVAATPLPYPLWGEGPARSLAPAFTEALQKNQNNH
jgi:hypothetical protein